MDVLFLSGINLLLSIVGTVFNALFFWLPSDPLSAYLDDLGVQAIAGQGLSWLNWFVDVQMAGSVFYAFVTVLLLFAAFKVIWLVVKAIVAALDAVPFIG